jgi:hypothetical protein
MSLCSLKECPGRVSKAKVFKTPKDLNVKKKWLQFMDKEGKKNLDENQVHLLCNLHFNRKSIIVSDGQRESLMAQAIPTIGCQELTMVILIL